MPMMSTDTNHSWDGGAALQSALSNGGQCTCKTQLLSSAAPAVPVAKNVDPLEPSKMLPRRRNNTLASGIIKERSGAEGGAILMREAKDRKREQRWWGYSLQEEEDSLRPSVRFFISGQIPRPHSDDRPEQFVHPSRPRAPVPPTQTASILSNIQPVRPGEGERLTMQSADRDRPIRSFPGPSVRRCQVINISNLARLHSFPLFT